MKKRIAAVDRRNGGVAGENSVALGFRCHSGWAAVVGVSRSGDAIEVIDRRRIELADSSIRGSVQPYHTAEEMDLNPARAYITRCINSTRGLAYRALKQMIDEHRQTGRKIAGCGMLLASGKPLPGLASILASHALIHTAEGELYREAIVQTSNRLKIPVTTIKERELFEHGETKAFDIAGKQTNRAITQQ